MIKICPECNEPFVVPAGKPAVRRCEKHRYSNAYLRYKDWLKRKHKAKNHCRLCGEVCRDEFCCKAHQKQSEKYNKFVETESKYEYIPTMSNYSEHSLPKGITI